MIDYSSGMDPVILKQAKLTNDDVEMSIRLAYQLSEAVKLRRNKIREQSLFELTEQEQEKRNRREQAEDDRIFLGAALVLTQRMKPRKKA